MKNYLLTVLESCSEHSFGQDAIEHAINTGAITLSYHLETDLKTITGKYDDICESYRAHKAGILAIQTFTADVSGPTRKRRTSAPGSPKARRVVLRT